MYREELKVGEEVSKEECDDQKQLMEIVGYTRGDMDIGVWDAKRALVGVGGRLLFYPSLLYNVMRNRLEPEFRWWDVVDENVLLGAVPFPAHVPHLKELGVYGVITLNEPFETLVPTSLYHSHGIKHLVIPTRDYLFAPSISDICQAVDFIHKNASSGKTTYVHCKAGRGRSTTVVLCYLVQYRKMTPESAYEYIKSVRPRVLLASAQWQAVEEFCKSKMGRSEEENIMTIKKTITGSAAEEHQSSVFDDASVVLITESDLVGYELQNTGGEKSSNALAELNLACKVQFASRSAFAKFSCLWPKSSWAKPRRQVSVGQCQSLGVDIRVC